MSVTITGIPELLNKFAALGQQGITVANRSLNVVADLIVAEAKDSAPADLGAIRKGIVKQQIDTLLFNVIAAAPESAFQEFGTGGKVDVPAEMADVAAQFQGAKGGDMAAFILALTDWVKRHGLTGVYSVKTHKRNNNYDNQDEQAAWAIAKTILRDGLTPQPFLYPAYINQSQKLLPLLTKSLQELLKSKQA